MRKVRATACCEADTRWPCVRALLTAAIRERKAAHIAFHPSPIVSTIPAKGPSGAIVAHACGTMGRSCRAQAMPIFRVCGWNYWCWQASCCASISPLNGRCSTPLASPYHMRTACTQSPNAQFSSKEDNPHGVGAALRDVAWQGLPSLNAGRELSVEPQPLASTNPF